MWKPLALASLLAAVGSARAADLGASVDFFAPSFLAQGALLAPSAGVTVVWDSGYSGQVAEPWDTVLFQGVCSDLRVSFEVSRQLAGGQWSAWIAATTQRFPRGRFWAKAVFDTKAPGPLRVRAIAKTAAANRKVEVLSVEVFAADPPMSKARSVPQIFAVGGGVRPAVYTREQWGAKPPREDYEPLLPYGSPSALRITLHHTDGLQPKTLAEAQAELRFIQDFHQNGRGWSDIAYHFLIDSAGHIFEGRPEGAEGSHTLHNNEGNFGVALMANHHPPKNDPVTKEELQALVELGRYLVEQYRIDPKSLKGHRDYRHTSCPGDIAYALLRQLRVEFARPQGVAGQPADATTGSKPKSKLRRPMIDESAAAPSWDGAAAD